MPPLVTIENLRKYFPLKGLDTWLQTLKGGAPAAVRAVDDISLSVQEGETVGLVGESGCGKSTVARCILRLLEPSGGRINFDGIELTTLADEPLRRLRRHLQMVFQDPTASLNPRLTVRRTVEEPLRLHTDLGSASRREAVTTVCEQVSLGTELLDRYPHELSGGQQQRVNIARAIATRPRFVILDEPTSALDVSLRAKIILLLADLRTKLGMTYLFISHDLATVKYLAHRVAVMYLGRIVEIAPTHELFDHPLHPYTRALLSAIPIPDPEVRRQRLSLSGEIPSPIHLPTGCRLRPRCPLAQAICSRPVELREVAPNHRVACHLT